MKLRVLPLLIALFFGQLSATKAQAPFIFVPAPITFVTATDAVFFAWGFLDADHDIANAIDPILYKSTASVNTLIGNLLSRNGNHLAALYFYGRASRYEQEAYTSGEL